MGQARILVVEDDSIIALELEDRLQILGYDVCAKSSSGEDAVKKANELRPDLILMDILLAGAMDGIEAAAEIRVRFDIPVVFLTAYADRDTLQRAKVTEPYGYIIKPFQERELHTAIEIALYKHQMEAKLKESERWLAATLRSISDAVVASGPTGQVAFMNPEAESLTGWESGDALDKDVGEVFRAIRELGRATIQDPVATALHNGRGAALAECLLITRRGTEIPIEGNTALIRDDNGSVRGVVLVFRDISERRGQEEETARLQAQLFHAQKMEAVGVLTGGLAHDFNNLMTTVIGYSSLILSHLSRDDPQRRGIQFMKKAGEQAASLTQQILAISRKQPAEPDLVDLNAVVIDMEEMVSRLVGEGTEVVSSLESGFRYVRADPAQLDQVLMNLLVNAQEAMPEGGRLTIRTENVTMDEEQVQSMPGASHGTFVCLSVTDTGIGMDTGTMSQMFEPFFSTKEKGTGLGLSVAKNIVEQHGGWIWAESTVGKGSTFRVYLPAFPGTEVGEARQVAALPELQGHGERVLLVEDNEGVRASVSEMLRASGYAVFEASSASQALDVFDEAQGAFDLVLSDVILRDRGGIQLVEELLAKSPGLSVLLTSGYADHRSQWSLIRDKGFRFLRKPFGLKELLPAVAETLQG
jgi:two-component system cell cycle sensor histidine kinase/response regulator CckA